MLHIAFQDVLQASTTKQVEMGTKAVTPDGNIWIYVYNSSNATITAGFIAVPAAVTTVGTTISSASNANSQTVFITKASAGWTVGAFAGGWVFIDNGTGEGQAGKIKDNTTDTLELFPAYALGTALDGTSTMQIWTQYIVKKSVTSTKIQNATGVAQVALPTLNYGWVLKEGLGRLVSSTAGTIGKSLVAGGSTAGEATIGTTAKGGFDEQIVGVCIVPSTNVDKAQLVQVTL